MRDLRVLGAYLGCCVMWALSWIFIKIGIRDFPPMLFAGIRCVLSAGVLFVYARLAGSPVRLRTVSHWSNFLVGLLFFGVPFIMIFVGEQTVDASVTAVVFACSPTFSVTLAWIFLKERLSPPRALGVLLGLSGILYLYLPALAASGFKANEGLLMILLGALSGSIGMIMAKTYLHQESPATALPIQMILVAPVILLASALTESIDDARWTASFALSLAYLAVFASGVAYALYFWLLKRLPVAQLVYIDFIYPVLSIFFARMVLGEPVSPRLAASTALIIFGGWLTSRSRPPA
ncbi:MAG: EamA family transporter [Acidobacteriota bacterium]